MSRVFAKKKAILHSLIELGQSNVSQIAKSAGVNRTTTYDILESLVAHLEKKIFELAWLGAKSVENN